MSAVGIYIWKSPLIIKKLNKDNQINSKLNFVLVQLVHRKITASSETETFRRGIESSNRKRTKTRIQKVSTSSDRSMWGKRSTSWPKAILARPAESRENSGLGISGGSGFFFLNFLPRLCFDNGPISAFLLFCFEAVVIWVLMENVL